MVVVLLGAASTALAAPAPAVDDGRGRCGTLARLHEHHVVRAEQPGAPTLLLGADKLDRDLFGYPSQQGSPNFIVRWAKATVTQPQAAAVLDTLELAWTIYNDDLRQTPPFGSDAYRINVYVDSEADDPNIAGIEAYAAVDDDNYPYVVLNQVLLSREPAWVDAIVAHELYHTYQYSLGGYQDDASYWWWEATADWAGQQVFPDNPSTYAYDGAYVLTEEMALFDAGDALTDPDHVTGLRQYGASLFPLYFTGSRDDRALVVDTWEHAGPQSDALDDFMAQLAPTPEGAADAFAEFATRLVAWDVPNAAVIRPAVEAFEASYPDRSRIDATVGAEGTDWASLPDARALHAYGFARIMLSRPADGLLILDMETDTADPPAVFRASVVRQTTAGPTYTPIDLTTGMGRLELTLPDSEPSAMLVVAATADTRDTTATYSFRYRVGGEPPGDAGGCRAAGTDGRSPLGPALGGLLIGLFVTRRRRRRASGHRQPDRG